MTNKNPATRIINYPSKFKPLLDRELDERGFFSYCELMGHILAEHYGNTTNKNMHTEDESSVIKGVKLNG